MCAVQLHCRGASTSALRHHWWHVCLAPRPFPLPGAVDQVLDELYAAQVSEPQWDELDGGSDDGEEGTGDEGDATAGDAAAAAAAAAGREASVLPSRPGSSGSRAPRRGKQAAGMTSLFTWAGAACCLAPLGSLLPGLRSLHVALPPSLEGVVVPQHVGDDVEDLPEAGITFVPPATAVRPFGSVTHLVLGSLNTDTHQWEPSARLGDKLLTAVADGLPALDTLQVWRARAEIDAHAACLRTA